MTDKIPTPQQQQIIDITKMQQGIKVQHLTIKYNVLNNEVHNQTTGGGIRRMLRVMDEDNLILFNEEQDSVKTI